MADPHHRYPENPTGAYYVDESCIDCERCQHHAPAFFRRDAEGAHSFVTRQPRDPGEVADCEEARDGCPVEAIGNDGEAFPRRG